MHMFTAFLYFIVDEISLGATLLEPPQWRINTSASTVALKNIFTSREEHWCTWSNAKYQTTYDGFKPPFIIEHYIYRK